MVSVIMSIYKERNEWVNAAIESILNQTYNDLELIIVIDNPTNYEAIALVEKFKEKDSRIACLVNDHNMGLAKSLNRGIDTSNGKLIARMDADDISCKDRIEKQVSYLEAHPEIDLVGGNICFIDENGRRVNKNSWVPTCSKQIEHLLRYTNIMKHPTIMFTRESISDIGGYVDINPSQDYELYTRMINSGKHICNMNDVVLNYRLHGESISGTSSLKQMINAAYIRHIYIHKIQYNRDAYLVFFESEKKRNRFFETAQKIYQKGLSKNVNGNKLGYIGCYLIAAIICPLRRHTIIEQIEIKKALNNKE